MPTIIYIVTICTGAALISNLEGFMLHSVAYLVEIEEHYGQRIEWLLTNAGYLVVIYESMSEFMNAFPTLSLGHVLIGGGRVKSNGLASEECAEKIRRRLPTRVLGEADMSKPTISRLVP